MFTLCKYLLESEITMVKKKIFIRLGHDILKNGKCTASKGVLDEYAVVREYGQALAELLKCDFDVKVFNSIHGAYGSSGEALKAGVTQANKWGADLFISCHANAYNGTANGTEVCYWHNDLQAKKLAIEVSNAISQTLNTRNRGAKDRLDLYEIKKTKMSSIILEPIFIDNKSDCIKYTNSKKSLLVQEIVKVIKQNLI